MSKKTAEKNTKKNTPETPQNPDEIRVQGINSKGFGIIPKIVMQDLRLTIEAKAIYAYFASYAGAGKQAFPGREKILYDLNISEKRYYSHFKLLKVHGYIEVEQIKKNGSYARNLYTLMDVVPYTRFACTQNACTQNDRTKSNKGLKSTIIKINNRNKSARPTKKNAGPRRSKLQNFEPVKIDSDKLRQLETAYLQS
jgi:hypothetical protein